MGLALHSLLQQDTKASESILSEEMQDRLRGE